MKKLPFQSALRRLSSKGWYDDEEINFDLAKDI